MDTNDILAREQNPQRELSGQRRSALSKTKLEDLGFVQPPKGFGVTPSKTITEVLILVSRSTGAGTSSWKPSICYTPRGITGDQSRPPRVLTALNV